MALSTLRPATSPRLSSVRLDLAGSVIVDLSVEPLMKDTGNDLRQVADEVTRIEREFKGAVYFTVVPDSVFKVVLGTLGVRFHSAMLTKRCGRSDFFSLVPCRYFNITIVEMCLSFGHSAVVICSAVHAFDWLTWTPILVLFSTPHEQGAGGREEREKAKMRQSKEE